MPDLPRALHNRIAQRAVQPDGRQHQPDHGEEAGEHREQSLAHERTIDQRLLRRDRRHAQERRGGTHFFAQPGGDRPRIAGHADVQGAEALQREQDVDRRRRRLAQVVANIRHDADDLVRRARPAEVRIEQAADRRLATEVALREGFVDDDDGGSLGVEIAADEAPSGEDRDRHRLEVSWRHRRHGHFDRLARGARHGEVVPPGAAEHVELGRADRGDTRDLRRSVEAERTRDVVLDLSEVSLVDGEVVRFLLRCEMQGIRLAHCPAYVREWMVREKRPP